MTSTIDGGKSDTVGRAVDAGCKVNPVALTIQWMLPVDPFDVHWDVPWLPPWFPSNEPLMVQAF